MENSYLKENVYIAKLAGEFLREMFANADLQAEYKGAKDIVTRADRGAEEIILEYLTETFREHKIVSEESGVVGNKESEYVWYVDPLDGTNNFFHHIPYFNVSIALEKNRKMVCGAVYNPILDEMFYAESGGGAFLNGKKIAPSTNKELSKAFITACHGKSEEEIARFLKLMNVFKREAYDIRKLGSAALELCYVACGRCDAFIATGLNPWDFKAGLLIAQESGCKSGGLMHEEIEESNLLVCSPSLYNELRKKIAQVI